MDNTYFIIDFDSTFVNVEGLEMIASVVLKNNPRKEKLLKEITHITDLGMAGKMAFGESLKRRMEILSVTKKDVRDVANLMKRQVTKSFLENKIFLKQFADHIYILSGGFKELIIPTVAQFGISDDHVFANTFVFDKKGNVIDIDQSNPLAHDFGKGKVVKQLKLKGDVYLIGDGNTDAQVKKSMPKITFVAFTENRHREEVIKQADSVVKTFDELLFSLGLPRKLSYPKTKIKVLLLENIDPSAVEALRKEGYDVEAIDKSLSKDELIRKVKDIQILGIRSRTQIDKDLFDGGKKLLVIGAFCIGTDQIDLKEATKRGIAVFNAPYSNTRSVVELVIGEIIMLARGVFQKSQEMHDGVWDKSAKGSFEIRGKTLGIIGYGNIGSQVSVLAENLGMKVIYYDVVEKLALGTAKPCRTLTELLKQSDIVTVHVDGRKENEGLIGEKEFSSMKAGSLFLNIARGKLVDIQALTRAIQTGKIIGAAVDVFPKEPKGKDEQFQSALRGLENVILTPHIGGSTREAQAAIGRFVSEKIISYCNTGNTHLNVSLPSIQLPDMKKSHRLLHIHENKPGILAKINTVLAKNKSNILGQYLKTNEEIGYVITDIDKKYNESVLFDLRATPGTIKVRLLY